MNRTTVTKTTVRSVTRENRLFRVRGVQHLITPEGETLIQRGFVAVAMASSLRGAKQIVSLRVNDARGWGYKSCVKWETCEEVKPKSGLVYLSQSVSEKIEKVQKKY